MVSHGEYAAVIGERLTVIVGRSGQRRAPSLSFDQQRTRMGQSFRGEPLWSPAVYHCRTDTIAVHLEMLFGPEDAGVVDPRDPLCIAAIDGLLGHELGHRRRRWIELWITEGFMPTIAALAAVPFMVAVSVGNMWPTSDAARVTDNLSMAVLVAAMCLFLVWCMVVLSFRRWRERRADIAMVRYAGVDAARSALDVLAQLAPTDLGNEWIHESPQRRRVRVDAFAERAGNVTPVEQTAPHKTEHDDWR